MIGVWKMLCESVQGNRGLAWSVWWNVGLLAFSLVAMPFDSRKILGLNPWIKPVKFDVSVIVFLLTIAVLLWVLPDAWRSTKVWVGLGRRRGDDRRRHHHCSAVGARRPLPHEL